MLALRLPPGIEKRLEALAKKTGRTKSDYAREAILRQIEDIEDYYLAQRRLSRGGSRVTLESLERDLKKR
jgi:RHH-type rel operon transcriptional repressor/antitoxin RelB